MHTTRCFVIAGWAILALGATNLAAQEGDEAAAPPAAAPAANGARPMAGAPMPYASGVAPGYGGQPNCGYGYPAQGYGYGCPPGGCDCGCGMPGCNCCGGNCCDDDCCDNRGFFHDEFYDNDGRGVMFGSAEALMWWSKGMRTPPLVTSSGPGTPFAQAGVLPGATVVAGGDNLFGIEPRFGGRGMFGRWITADRSVGLAGRFTMVDNAARTDTFASAGNLPIFAVPFTDLAIPGNAAFPVSFPLGPDGIQREGSIQIASSQQFMTAEAYGRVMMTESPVARIDLMSGYHFARIDSGFEIQTDTLIQADPALPVGSRFTGVDRFNTQNQFHGMEVGLIADRRRGRWGFSSLAKVSYGAMIQTTRISGSNTVTFPGFPPAVGVGNVFTQPSNIGTHTRTIGVLAPEMNLNVVYHIAPRLSISGGYTFIWFNRVATAGDAISPVINTNFFPPPVNPAFAFKDNDFWIMGGNVGLNWDF